ncbi:MAG TPA: hydroxymethylglutaryl-CoA lyase [Magnetospirillaceae bacterium]|jgi:isopropylmalate/homocitrate/citramalate synthase
MTNKVTIVDVGARDGLQNEAVALPVETKIALIERLADAGIPVVEAGAFVSAKWVPQMADSAEVLRRLMRKPGVRYPVLVPNIRGYDDAHAAQVNEIAVFAAASESFSQKNINCSIAESLERFRPVCDRAKADGVRVRGYISCVLGCPYEGAVPVAQVVKVAEALTAMGCAEISLGDTIGVGTPSQAKAMLHAVAQAVPMPRLAVHFHDTYGQALANILACLEDGVRIVDSSVAGLGGCPYAKGASGNVGTEDVVYMLRGLGMETGVDLDKLVEAGMFVTSALRRAPASKTAQALAAKRA